MAENPIFPEMLIARLSCIFEPKQLADFVKACEVARDSGNGYAQVEIIFHKYSPIEFRGHFGVKSPDDAHRQVLN